MYQWVIKRLIRFLAKGAANEILMGRLIEKGNPERGRFLKHDVQEILNQAWQNVDTILPESKLDTIPTKGNQLNVFLAVVTVGAYHALLNVGIEKEYAIELFADIGWKVYAKLLPLPRFIARIVTKDKQKQINIILRLFMLYPFSTPGRPGYECKAWSEPGYFCTYWTHCPPFEFVRQYVKQHGDEGELEAYQKSWCEYDWALTYAMVNGAFGVQGHYERPHTLSFGDDVCDMHWRAKVPKISNQN